MLSCSGGLPSRQNRQLPKARHGAGARTSVHHIKDTARKAFFASPEKF